MYNCIVIWLSSRRCQEGRSPPTRSSSRRPIPRSPRRRSRERALLRLDSLHRAGSLPGEVARVRMSASGDRVIECMRPIVAQQRCLACHGERKDIAPSVLELLAARYPSDQATGYRAGDLRGMISVRVQP
ncbi:MAG TPA: DUF3365 domain-containing protein [Gemmatimonadales bacterium]